MSELVKATEDLKISPPAATHDRWSIPSVNPNPPPSTVNIMSRDPSSSPKPFYVTTAINYANGPGHMGHAYEGITADIISRYHRCTRTGCYFLTGSDEHGQKIAGVAEAEGVAPRNITDKYVIGFKNLNARMAVSNDDYLRTIDERHKATAKVRKKLHCFVF